MKSLQILESLTLADDAWTQVDLVSLAVSKIILHCRSAVAVMLATSDDPSDSYFTLASGQYLTLDMEGSQVRSVWAKSADGAVELEMLALI